MAELDPLIHQPARLRIAAALAAAEADAKVDFTFLRDCLQLTDGNLGAHLSKLEKAGYVHLEKTFVDRKPRTYIELTRRGRSAFQDHVAALQAILDLGRNSQGKELSSPQAKARNAPEGQAKTKRSEKR